jgi:hypothetical protein
MAQREAEGLQTKFYPLRTIIAGGLESRDSAPYEQPTIRGRFDSSGRWG